MEKAARIAATVLFTASAACQPGAIANRLEVSTAPYAIETKELPKNPMWMKRDYPYADRDNKDLRPYRGFDFDHRFILLLYERSTVAVAYLECQAHGSFHMMYAPFAIVDAAKRKILIDQDTDGTADRVFEGDEMKGVNALSYAPLCPGEEKKEQKQGRSSSTALLS